MFLKLQKWSKGWEHGWIKMPQTYCTFDHGGCHACGKTTWICETLDADRSSTVPKKLCECPCQWNVSSTQEWRGACYAGSCQFHARYRKRQTDCYLATAHLLHFDNLIFDMLFTSCSWHGLTRFLIVLSLQSFVQSGHLCGIVPATIKIMSRFCRSDEKQNSGYGAPWTFCVGGVVFFLMLLGVNPPGLKNIGLPMLVATWALFPQGKVYVMLMDTLIPVTPV